MTIIKLIIKKQLHLITHNIPYPANYGGVIDVFYKIVALKKLGVGIHLHCFKYGRDEAVELEQYCEKVYYYDRKMDVIKLFSIIPFIVKTRDHEVLTKRLVENPYPILYDGLHCTYTLNNLKLKQKKIIRTHNVEANYYQQLAKSTSNIFIKLFYYSEFLKLALYEKNIAKADAAFAISENDKKYFSDIIKCYLIRAFHSNTKTQNKTGIGEYALYHGNLTVSENIKALRFLLNGVFSSVNFPLTIAGKITNQKLIKEIKKNSFVTLVENPDNQQMSDLIQEAHLILLPTFQRTGIKLKLLESLFKGRFCIANNPMIENTELETYCIQANTSQEWIDAIKRHINVGFSAEIAAKRAEISDSFNNLQEAQKMIDLLFED